MSANTVEKKQTEKFLVLPMIALALAQMGTSGDTYVLNVATRSILEELGANMNQMQIATMVYALMASCFMMFGGMLGVKIGWNKNIKLGALLCAVGELVAALSPSILVFTWCGRVLTGIGGSLLIPSVFGTIVAIYKGQNRIQAFGYLSAAVGLAYGIPLLAGAAVDKVGWRYVYAGLGVYFFISPVQILVELTEMIQKGLSGFRRFLAVLATEPDIQDKEDAKEIEDVSGEVEFDHVSFRYTDEEAVLSDISFKIEAGRSVALVGPSGGGKTTICSLIPRFYDVTGGRVLVDQKDVRDLTMKSLRSKIGIVQQDVYLFCGTIRENIAYGKPDASMDEIIEAAKKANIHEFIMELPEGYDTFVGERGTRLSGGQKQRISIARVFLKNPPILILDEATSALDNESERRIQKSLEALAKDRTTITIAHRLSTIRNADEIIVINEAGIAERGTHKELLGMNGLYAHYYKMQFEGLETVDCGEE